MGTGGVSWLAGPSYNGRPVQWFRAGQAGYGRGMVAGAVAGWAVTKVMGEAPPTSPTRPMTQGWTGLSLRSVTGTPTARSIAAASA